MTDTTLTPAPAPPQWLSPAEQAAWRAFMTTTRLLFYQVEKDLLTDSSIPLAYYAILVLLSEAPDYSMRMYDLAAACSSIPSSISHAITRLESKGWIRREMCPRDRRGWFAILTDQGLAALVQAAPSHCASVRRNLFDTLTSAEVDSLRQLCEKLNLSLETTSLPA
jgi:DNA-binding MarR family transcriptional regulator